MVFRKTTASENSLERIFSCTPALKHLVYDYSRFVACDPPHWECTVDFSPERPTVLIHAQRLSKALSWVCNTLESLALKVRFASDWDIDITGPGPEVMYLCRLNGRVAGLERMPRLSVLEIFWAMLFGWPEDKDIDQQSSVNWADEVNSSEYVDGMEFNLWTNVLPSSITQLKLRDDLSGFYHYPLQVLDPLPLSILLLKARQRSFSNLQKISFAFTRRGAYNRRGLLSILMHDLRTCCEAWELFCEVICKEQ